jgi:hypothetical protein
MTSYLLGYFNNQCLANLKPHTTGGWWQGSARVGHWFARLDDACARALPSRREPAGSAHKDIQPYSLAKALEECAMQSTVQLIPNEFRRRNGPLPVHHF